MRTSTPKARPAEGTRRTSGRPARKNEETPRPIHVIGGFLGSGKTTLLLRILDRVWADGAKPAVIMNEYGERSVDGKLLGDHDHRGALTVAELMSGCVCCDLADGLTDAVVSLLRSTSGPIFVETTGLAIVGQVADAVERALADADVRTKRAALASIIVAVDATRYRETQEIWSHMSSDLRSADTIVMTKCDRAPRAVLDELEAALRRRHPRARILRSSNANLDPRALLTPTPARSRPGAARRTVANSAEGFESVTCRILGPVDADRLGSILGRFEPALARVKGFVHTMDGEGLHAVQWVPGTLEVTRHRGRRVSPHLVVIGKDLDWQRFADALDEAVESVSRRASAGGRA